MRKLRDIDRRHIWRPYTSREDHLAREMLDVERAEGPWLIDRDGRKLLDASGSWWCSNLGHQHPRLVHALRDQAEVLLHCTFADVMHEQAVLLAAELIDVAPRGLSRVFYGDNGSTAVEIALKIAFQYWQQNGHPKKTGFIALPGAYHGDTIGAMAVSAVDEFNAVFSPLLFDVSRAPSNDGEDWLHTFGWIEKELTANASTIAAVIVEPVVQGANGMRMYPAAYLSALRAATKKADVLLICDEVFTGFGRTGQMWASDHAEVTPDLLCTAKGLTGGTLPFSATLATEAVYEGFDGDQRRALMHGHTFYGNPLGARLAREVLAIYRDENILDGVTERAQMIANAFGAIRDIEGVRSTRALGMIGAADLGDRGYYGKLGRRVYDAALQRGAHLRPLGNTVYVVPPLNIELDVLEQLLQITAVSISDVMSKRISE